LNKEKALLRRLTVVNDAGERHLKLVGREQRCIALEGPLGKSVSCSIYQLRPASCRKLKPGSWECLRDRKERGIR
jgi:Fe-S-cluster containining protein